PEPARGQGRIAAGPGRVRHLLLFRRPRQRDEPGGSGARLLWEVVLLPNPGQHLSLSGRRIGDPRLQGDYLGAVRPRRHPVCFLGPRRPGRRRGREVPRDLEENPEVVRMTVAHALVVGGSRGLGRVFAQMARNRGWRVTVLGRTVATPRPDGYYAFD